MSVTPLTFVPVFEFLSPTPPPPPTRLRRAVDSEFTVVVLAPHKTNVPNPHYRLRYAVPGQQNYRLHPVQAVRPAGLEYHSEHDFLVLLELPPGVMAPVTVSLVFEQWVNNIWQYRRDLPIELF